MGIHRTGPCLASQSVEGGAGLQDAVGGEDMCRMDIRLNWKLSVCGGGRGVDSVQLSVCGGERGVDSVQFCLWRWKRS